MDMLLVVRKQLIFLFGELIRLEGHLKLVGWLRVRFDQTTQFTLVNSIDQVEVIASPSLVSTSDQNRSI